MSMGAITIPRAKTEPSRLIEPEGWEQIAVLLLREVLLT
jgi:hypothetical protein